MDIFCQSQKPVTICRKEWPSIPGSRMPMSGIVRSVRRDLSQTSGSMVKKPSPISRLTVPGRERNARSNVEEYVLFFTDKGELVRKGDAVPHPAVGEGWGVVLGKNPTRPIKAGRPRGSNTLPFLKDNKDGQYDEPKTGQVVPAQLLVFKEKQGEAHKDHQRNGFLDGL